jgi:hypothetical protein
MGKNGSKNFVNQFKNTKRQAGRQGGHPLGSMSGMEKKKPVNAVFRKSRLLKKFPPGQGK